jgi:hypothetical protein
MTAALKLRNPGQMIGELKGVRQRLLRSVAGLSNCVEPGDIYLRISPEERVGSDLRKSQFLAPIPTYIFLYH